MNLEQRISRLEKISKQKRRLNESEISNEDSEELFSKMVDLYIILSNLKESSEKTLELFEKIYFSYKRPESIQLNSEKFIKQMMPFVEKFNSGNLAILNNSKNAEKILKEISSLMSYID